MHRRNAGGLFRRVASLVLILTLATAAAGFTAAPKAGQAGGTRRVILELTDPPVVSAVPPGAENRAAAKAAAEYAARLKRAQQQVRAELAERKITFRERRSYTHLYNGIALEVAASDVAVLAAIPGVKRVHADARVQARLDQSVPLIRAPEVWEQSAGGQPVTGHGMVVAIVDTGVDYMHPDLGGGFGEGFKVVGGYDFVDQDADPMDENGHGTHVAGIVAANGTVKGVAPDAQITAYRVLDEWGSGYLSDVVAGLEAAVSPTNPHRAQVVNLSLGGPGDGLTDPVSVAAQNAVAAGVVVVAAAGNDGPAAQTVGSPGAAPGVLTVGASISGVVVPRLTMVAPETKLIKSYRMDFSANPPPGALTLPVVDAGAGDFRGAVGKAALIAISPWASSSDVVASAVAAREAGAAAALFYLDEAPVGWGGMGDGGDGTAVVHHPPRMHQFAVGPAAVGDPGIIAVELEEAAPLRELVSQGVPVTVAITGEDVTDQIASFSSRGPGPLLGMKPDLVAPGVLIHSTMAPESLWGQWEFGGALYGRMSGTSMAAPHVAGAAALIRQVHPDWSPVEIGSALAHTGRLLPTYSPLDQGAGRMDVAAAASVTVVADTLALSFPLADLTGPVVSGARTFQLTNKGSEPVTVSLSAADASSVPAGVQVSPATLALGPGQSGALTVSLSLPTPTADADVMGWVEARAGGQSLRVPYYLPVRTLMVVTSPDPTPADSEAFIWSPVELAAAPVVSVTGPGGKRQQVTATFDHGNWWRAPLAGGSPGIYHLQVAARSGPSVGGATIIGRDAFEVVPTERQNPAANTWKPVGPNSFGGWMAQDPNNPNRMVVAAWGLGSLFLTRDGLKTWEHLAGLPVAYGNPVGAVIDQRGRIYVAMASNPFVDPSYQGKLFASDDGGKSWTTLDFPDERPQNLLYDKATGSLVAITEQGARVSRDRGATWDEVTIPAWGVHDGFLLNGSLYLLTWDGLWVVPDAAAGGEPGQPREIYSGWITRARGEGSLLVVGKPFDGIFGSTDGGATWNLLFQPPGWSQIVDVVDGHIYVESTGGYYVGTNNGTRWTEVTDPNAWSPDVDVAKTADGRTLIASEVAGIFATTDLATYTRVGVPGIDTYDLAVGRTPAGAPTLVAATPWNTYVTALPQSEAVTADTLEWGPSGYEGGWGTTAWLVATSPADPSVMFKVQTDAIDRFHVARSRDGGTTWTEVALTQEFPLSLLIHPADPDQIYIGFQSTPQEPWKAGLLVSRDGGDTWEEIHHGKAIQALAADPANPDRIYLSDRTTLYASADGGYTLAPLQSMAVTSLATTPDAPARVIAGTREGIFVSRDRGQSFTPGDYGLPVWVRDILITPGKPDVIYAATGGYGYAGLRKGGRGVLRSTDGGRTWRSFSPGLSERDTFCLALSPDGTHLYVGTQGGGVQRIKLTTQKKK
jgi:subtilisin family serine protease